MSAVRCQRCGAELRLESEAAPLVACDYCGAVMAVTSGVLSVVGERAKLVASRSMFSLGGRFTIEGVAVRCVGRARYAYDEGRWEEWDFLGDDGGVYRIQDDEGDLVLFEFGTYVARPAPAPARPRPASIWARDGHRVLVAEIGTARLEGAAGTLLAAVFADDEPFAYVDGHAEGRYVSVRDGRDATQWLWGRPIGRPMACAPR